MEAESSKSDIIKRLKRIDGQVNGILKMVEEEKYCVDILTQIAAVRAAVNRVGGLMLEKHVKTCMQNALKEGDRESIVNDLIDTVQKFMRFVD